MLGVRNCQGSFWSHPRDLQTPLLGQFESSLKFADCTGNLRAMLVNVCLAADGPICFASVLCGCNHLRPAEISYSRKES